MKKIKSSFMFLTFLFLITLGITVQAQQTTSTCEGGTQTYTVDANDGANGTPGSTYEWSIVEATFTGTIPTDTDNSIDINWGTTPPGNYTVRVVETSDKNCIGDAVTLAVTINSGATTPTITTNGPICENEDAQFTITGTPSLIVSYQLNGGATQTATIAANGTVLVTVNNATSNQVLTITSIDNGTCTTTITGVSSTIVVNPKPTTSNIVVS